MAAARETIQRNVHQLEIDLQLRVSPGSYQRRRVDESLLDFEAMHALMLPFCSDEWAHATRKLAKLSILFMQTPHYKRAVELGWLDVDFFGISQRSPNDAKPRGLLPTLAWSQFKGKLRGIDREGAKIATLRENGDVNSMMTWRPHPCPGTVPFWQCEGLE